MDKFDLQKQLDDAFAGVTEKTYDRVLDEDTGKYIKVPKRVQKKQKTGMVKKNKLGVMGRPALEPIIEETDGINGMAVVPMEYDHQKKQRNDRIKR